MKALTLENLSRKAKFTYKTLRADLESLRYGVYPKLRYLGLAWCNPNDISLSTRYFVPKKGGYLQGSNEIPLNLLRPEGGVFITGGEWDKHTTMISDVKHISRTIRKYEHDTSWQEVGEVDWMMENIKSSGEQDGCTSLDDVLQRCEAFDQMAASLKSGGRLYSRKEMGKNGKREYGGIGIAVGRNGELIWFSNGAHRLALSQYLHLAQIPVCVLMVHQQAVENNSYTKNLRFAKK